ncbi:PAS domain-containing sensor histidine kinase [Streptomyces tanashiensis]
MSEWQLLSDLSFADLVLWVPTLDGTRYVSVAQMRPNTGPTSYQDDMVGHLVPRGRRPLLDAALDEGRIVREGDPSGARRCPSGSSPSPCAARAGSSASSPATPTC